MGRLDGKRVLITGGTTGIGFATAKLFLAEGARVAVTGQDGGRVAAAGKALGDRALALQADVTRAEDLGAAISRVAGAFGQIDVLFANAGIAPFAPIDQVTDEHISAILDTNVRGLINTVRLALPHLGNPASVILTASTAADKAAAGGSVYAASKAAVRSLARSLSAELVGRGVRVNALSPGLTETPILAKAGLNDAMIAHFAGTIPAGRLADAEEMAEAALYLASDASRYMVGGNLLVDGGNGTL
jgi:NAD(P)-dependent dehydrogenase (short-subunit alcohol dehydrogenase family)